MPHTFEWRLWHRTPQVDPNLTVGSPPMLSPLFIAYGDGTHVATDDGRSQLVQLLLAARASPTLEITHGAHRHWSLATAAVHARDSEMTDFLSRMQACHERQTECLAAAHILTHAHACIFTSNGSFGLSAGHGERI